MANAPLIGSEVREGCNWYLQQLAQSEVRTLKDIIKFNEDHPSLSLTQVCFYETKDLYMLFSNSKLDYGPDQNGLKLVDCDDQSPADVQSMLQHCKQWAVTSGFDKLAEEDGVDFLVGPADSFFAGITVAARESYFRAHALLIPNVPTVLAYSTHDFQHRIPLSFLASGLRRS